MPKIDSPKLFNLIKSLTPTERRYFKMWVDPNNEKNSKYILLFDAIEAQTDFDDAALKKLIYPEKTPESRKYSELKNYLYNEILKALQHFDEKTSVEFRIKNMLLNVKVLFKRSLFHECKEQLQKIKKLALEYEDYLALLEVLRWEKELAYTMTDIALLNRQLESFRKNELEYLGEQTTITELRNLFFKLLVELRKDVTRSKEHLVQLKKIADNNLINHPANTVSTTAHLFRLRFLSAYYFSISDFEKFYETSKTLLKEVAAHPHFLKESVSEYISVLNNHIVSCGQLEKYAEVRTYLQKLKSVQPITKDDALKIHRQYYLAKFRLCISSGEFEEGIEALKSHESESLHFEKFYFEKNTFYFHYFLIYFGVNDYEKALHYLNEWLNMPRNIERQDLQSLARVLNLIIHFEMKNDILLESLLRSTQRFLRKRSVYQFEKLMVQFIKDSRKMFLKDEIKKALQNLQSELKRLLMLPEEAQLIKMFDFESWLESKLTGKPFKEIVREKFNRKSTPPS